MKHYAIIFLLLFSCAAPMMAATNNCKPCNPPELCDPCACKAISHTFFSVHPQYEVGSPEYLSLFYDRIFARDGECGGGAVQIVPFGGKSVEQGNMAAFFFPKCRTQLRVNGDFTTAPEDVDVLAPFFTIFTADEGDFSSVINFAPQQTVFGVGLSYKQTFARRSEDREFWFGISTPITYVRNNVGFCERVIDDGGGASDDTGADGEPFPANMTEAFIQPSWECGRVQRCCNLTKTGFADITAEVGYLYLNKDDYHAETHVGILIPTGNCVKGRNVFEPMVGHNKHFGVTFGSSVSVEFWQNECGDKRARLEMNMQNMYLFRRIEHRLIDLKNKPWSRYMPTFANREQAQEAINTGDPFLYTPGVNVFCRDLCVKPGLQHTFNSAFVLTTDCGFIGEAGYNLFCRHAECVLLATAWEEGPALKSFAITEGLGATDRVQQINDVFNFANATSIDDYEENIIHACDLDLNSAAHPSMITNTFYGALGYRWDEREYPVFLGAGASYEFSADNTGMNRWLLWAKTGFSF